MATPDELTMEEFKALVSRAGMTLSDSELSDLKEKYEFSRPGIDALHQVDLGTEDLAVSFDPTWASPPGPPRTEVRRWPVR